MTAKKPPIPPKARVPAPKAAPRAAVKGTPKKAMAKTKGRPSLISFLWIWFRRLALIFVLSSIFSVLMYRWIDPPFTALMLKRAWEYHSENHEWKWTGPSWADADEISPNYFRAIVAGEDQRFMDHWGFDLDAIQAAAKWNQRHKRKRGASTLSQQVAKNVFLWEDRSWIRKGLEVWFTLWIEMLWSKERILEVHANVAELSPWSFGVQDNARKWFGKNAKALSPREAALLAAALPKPRAFNGKNPAAFYTRKQLFIQRNMKLVEIPKP